MKKKSAVYLQRQIRVNAHHVFNDIWGEIILSYFKIFLLSVIFIIPLSSCKAPDDTSIVSMSSNTVSSDSLAPTISSSVINSSTDELIDTITMDSGMQYGTFENPNPPNIPVNISYEWMGADSEKTAYLDYTITIKSVYKNREARDKAKELGESFGSEDFYEEYQNLETHDVYLFYVVLEYRSGSDQERRDCFDLIDKNGVMQSYSSNSIYRVNNDFYENKVNNNRKEGWISRSVDKGTNPLKICLGIGDPAVAPGIVSTFYFAIE